MSGKQTFKLVLIALIFSVSVLIVLPEIPVVVDSDYLILNSSIGGMQIKIPWSKDGKMLDLKEFKKGSGIGESKKLSFELKNKDLENKPEVISRLLSVTQKRLNLSRISDYKVSQESEDKISITIPTFEDSDRINSIVIGSGKIIFRTVKNPQDWSKDKFQNFYLESDRWQDTDINENDVQGFVNVMDQTGVYKMQIVFTDIGRQKFYDLAGKNIGLPIAVYVSNFDYPFLMPMIGENILDNKNLDPAVNNTYPQYIIDDYNLQIKNPLPEGISAVETTQVPPVMGSNFIEKYAKAFFISILLISAYFLLKFNVRGLVFSYSLLLSVLIYLAISKLFSIPVGTQMFLSLILVMGIMTYIGDAIHTKINKDLISGVPFEISFNQVLVKDKSAISYPSILILSVSLILYFISSGFSRTFYFSTFAGMLVVVLFYSFLFPTLLWAFKGGERPKEK